MDFWEDIAFAIVLRILKNKKQREQFMAVLFKVHGKIEEAFPQLQPENRTNQSLG